MSTTKKINHVQGVVFDSDDPHLPVTDAILTDTRFVCDYRVDDDMIHIEADSSDGITFRGRWGWPRLHDGRNTIELTRFESKHNEIVLLGM